AGCFSLFDFTPEGAAICALGEAQAAFGRYTKSLRAESSQTPHNRWEAKARSGWLSVICGAFDDTGQEGVVPHEGLREVPPRGGNTRELEEMSQKLFVG